MTCSCSSSSPAIRSTTSRVAEKHGLEGGADVAARWSASGVGQTYRPPRTVKVCHNRTHAPQQAMYGSPICRTRSAPSHSSSKKTRLVRKFKAASEHFRHERGKCEGRNPHAQTQPDAVYGQAPTPRQPEHGQTPLVSQNQRRDRRHWPPQRPR